MAASRVRAPADGRLRPEVRDARPSKVELELVASVDQPALVGKSTAFEAYAVRWRAFGEVHGVDLVQPDFPALMAACGVPARVTSVDKIDSDLAWLLDVAGPAALVLRERLTSALPTS